VYDLGRWVVRLQSTPAKSETVNPNQESPADVFRRVIRTAIEREPFECSTQATPLQTTCLSYLRTEQAWLDKMLQTRHVRQPGIIYGFYESPEGELQAYAIERVNETPGFIAVSTYCVVSIGFFFRAALAHGQILVDFGDPTQELSALEMGAGPHLSARPRDPERLRLVHLLTMRAMRFLTAHEMTHILNGHLRYRLGVGAPSTIAEARQMLLPKDAVVSQTLEMDADSGAVVDCMPFVIFAERDPQEPARLGCHPVYQKPEAALRLWLFAVYGFCRLMEDDARQVPIEQASHPSPMMRIQMIMGTLLEFLRREKLDRLVNILPDLIEATIRDGEAAYAAVLNREPDIEPLRLTLTAPAQKQMATVIDEWRNVRPIVEPFARGGKLAPLPREP
jgi:hypothetical protein